MSSETAATTSPSPLKISALMIKPTLPLTAKMADLYRQRRKETLVSVSLAEAVEQISTGFQGVLLLSLAAEGDIVPISNFFKTLQTDHLSSRVHVIIVSKMNNVKLKHAFMRMGASEYLQDSVTPSTLFFRTVYYISQLQSQNEKPKEDSSKRFRNGGSNGSNDNEKITVTSFQVSKEIIGDDTWIVRGLAPKKIGVQWVIESEGPDPDSGGWEFTGLDGKRQEQWTWRPHDSNGYPLLDQGENGWTFSGNRPTFQVESGKWKFVGNEPDLSYAKDGKKDGSKIKTDPELGIILAADNDAAEGRIKESQAIGELVKKRREEEHRQAQAKAEAEKASRQAAALTEKEVLDKKRRTDQAESEDEHTLPQKAAANKLDAEKKLAHLNTKAGEASSSNDKARLTASGEKVSDEADSNNKPAEHARTGEVNGSAETLAQQKKADEQRLAKKAAELNAKATAEKQQRELAEQKAKAAKEATDRAIAQAKAAERTRLEAEAAKKAALANDVKKSEQAREASSASDKRAVEEREKALKTELEAQTKGPANAASNKTNKVSHLGFFLKLSDMISGSKPSDEVFRAMLTYLGEALKANQASIYTVGSQKDLNFLTLEHTTNTSSKMQRNLDLRTTQFSDIFSSEKYRVVPAGAGSFLLVIPVIRQSPAKANLGILVLQFYQSPTVDAAANAHLIVQMTKQFKNMLNRVLIVQKKLAA